MRKNISSLIAWIAVIGLITVAAFRPDVLSPPETAFAVGDLVIDWGVTAGDPIFTVPDFAPGETETRTVNVTNNASSDRPVGVRGVRTDGNGISNELDIVMAADGTDVYGGSSSTGPTTLEDFFNDSAGPSGIPLLTLSPGEDVDLAFTVAFSETAGNDVQGESVTFDIVIGIAIELPDDCEAIEFDGDPIFGTSRGERLRGTPGNDLVIGFEGGDRLIGLGGDDCLIGNEGGDRLDGGDGNDILFGNQQGDSLNGGDGEDKLFGGDQGDGLNGGDGDDFLDGGAQSDGLRGGSGDDELIGGPGSDSARGGSGFDTCDAESEQSCEA
jgi:Ca2+-binding RTX toxin-like protein